MTVWFEETKYVVAHIDPPIRFLDKIFGTRTTRFIKLVNYNNPIEMVYLNVNQAHGIETESRQEKLDRIFKKMTRGEQMELLTFSLAGGIFYQGDDIMILKGSHFTQLQREFEDKMIKKYDNQ